MSDSLPPHGLQCTRLSCPSLSPTVFSNSCPLSQWCHPTISSSVVPFSSCPQSFPASGSFPMNWLLASGGLSIGASASAAVLPMNIQGWFPLGLTGRISLQSKGLSRVFSSTLVQKDQFFSTQLSLWSNSHMDLSLGFLPSGFPLYEVALFIYLLVCLLILSAWHAGSNSDPQKWKCRVLTTAPTGNSQGQL